LHFPLLSLQPITPGFIEPTSFSLDPATATYIPRTYYHLPASLRGLNFSNSYIPRSFL
jgi:hypothetical protein